MLQSRTLRLARPTAVLALAYFATAMVGAGLPAAHAQEKILQRTVTVSASGSVQAAPDQARINTGVSSDAPTAREALTKNSDAMSKVIAELKTGGVDAKDIQTNAFNVEPVMNYPKDGAPPTVSGYRVTNQVIVLVRDLGKLGDALDKLVSAGANQINGLEFGVSNAETLADDARAKAMENARRRAVLLAKAGGAELGEVVQIAEEALVVPRPYGGARMAMAEKSVPIETGTETLEARVNVTWALK